MVEKVIITNKKVSFKDGMVHSILSHSYIVFFMAVIFGAIFHTIFNFKIFSNSLYQYIGFILIIIGSLLIYWAQYSSGHFKKEIEEERTIEDFERGPYKYSRNPTHIGLTIMNIGLVIVLNSFFMLVFIIIASFITKLIFLKEEERLLEEKYGKPYVDYKKKVGMWI